MTGWRLRDLVVDGLRNIAGSRARTVLLAVVTAGLVGGLVFSELATTGELLAFQDGFVESGGNVFIATSQQGLPADRCAATGSMPGVVGSAGVQPGEPVDTNQSPGTLFNTGAVTVGALDVFTVGSAPDVADVVDGWIVGAFAAGELGVDEGMWLGVDGGKPRMVGAVVDTETRNPRIDRWIMTVQPAAGTVDECWVEFAPGVDIGRRETLSAVFSDASDTIVTPWIRLDEFARDPVAELVGRPQTSAWIVGGLLLASMGWLVTWFRRPQIGLYRAVGTGPSSLLILGMVELGLPILVGAVTGFLWAAAFSVAGTDSFSDPDQMSIALRSAASTTLLALTAAPLLWPLTARGSIADQLKDR